MAFDTRIKQMQAHFSSNFTGVVANQIVWDGVPNAAIDKNSSWVSVYIDPNIANIKSLGTKRIRHEGHFVVQIFTKKDGTSDAANVIAENVAAALEAEVLAGGVIFGASIIQRLGIRDGYYQINVFTSYRYTDIRT